jgi:predicted nucleic acid-binding protein
MERKAQMNDKMRLRFAVDASVILKWFSKNREKDLEKALQIREDFRNRKIDLFAPELLIYEIVNVLRYKETLKDELILKAIQSIFAMEILTPVNMPIMKDALKLARKHNITVYDSTYLSFAQHSGFYLITADRKFFQKLNTVPGITYISKYDLSLT